MAVATRETRSELSYKIADSEVTGYWLTEAMSPPQIPFGPLKRRPFRPASLSHPVQIDTERYELLPTRRLKHHDDGTSYINNAHEKLDRIANERIRLLALKASKSSQSKEINARLLALNEEMNSLAPAVSRYTIRRLDEVEEQIRSADSLLADVDSFLSDGL